MHLSSRQETLVAQLVRIPVDYSGGEDSEPGSRPAFEGELAAEPGVSRATVRDALNNLPDRELAIWRQGVGTFVGQVPSLCNPLNEFTFAELVADSGFESGFSRTEADEPLVEGGEGRRRSIAPEACLNRTSACRPLSHHTN